MKKILVVLLFFVSVGFSQTAVDILRHLEGEVIVNGRHYVYDDADRNVRWNGKESFVCFAGRCKGKPTIGYGITEAKIVEKCWITQDEADYLLLKEANNIRRFVLKETKVPLTHYQREALVSFAYNIGRGNFKKSTLLKKLNSKNYKDISFEMSRWKFVTIKGEKTVSRGLVNRRRYEIDFFEKK